MIKSLVFLGKHILKSSPEELKTRFEKVRKDIEFSSFTGNFPNILEIIELSMITQRIMELSRAELDSENNPTK